MKNQHIGKQFIKYVAPAVVGMLVQSLYVVLDGVVVGQGIGEIALAAVNIGFPISVVTIAIGMLIGVGGANVYSFYKGQNQKDKLNNIFTQSFSISIILGLVIGVLGLVFCRPIAVFLGANETLLPSTVAYLKWLFIFAVLQMSVCSLSVFIRNDEAPRLVMVASITGAVCNVILDIIFVIVLGYGIEATVITNGIGLSIELAFYATHFLRKKGALRIRLPRFNWQELRRIVSNGFATFLMEFSLPVATLSFNLAIIRVEGTLGITAYSIVCYVCSIMIMVLIGVTQGVQPLMSLYHGSDNKEAFRKIYRMGMIANIVLPSILVVLCALFSENIVALFSPGNPELTKLTSHMLWLYPLGNVAIGPTLMNILYFQTTERNVPAAIISFLRCVGFIQIFLLISFYGFGGTGLYLTYAAGESCHLLISQIMVRYSRKKEEAAQKGEQRLPGLQQN